MKTWGENVATTVARQVRAYRQASRMSGQELANRCTELGFPMHRSTLSNFENGHRRSVDVAEVLVFAEALGVPPVRLLWPLDGSVEPLPNVRVPAYVARDWFRGTTGLTTKGDR